MVNDIRDLSLVLIGIGGYGNSYLSSLFDRPQHPVPRVVGVADPSPAGCKYLHELHHRRIPVYPSMAALQKNHHADLVVVSSPPHLHCQQTVSALVHGSHVLCEKPLAGSVMQAREMMRTRDRVGKQVSIGYQWSFSSAIQNLKRDIASGLFGRPKGLRTLVLWPRSEAYYARNSWVGRRFTQDGMPILDSPLNNACAHHLHNMMYVLGPAIDRSAVARSVAAELYRVNDIETFDTAAVRVRTTEGTEILCIVSHASNTACGPLFRFDFEHARIVFDGDQPTPETRDGASIRAFFNDGREKDYGSPERAPDQKLWSALDSALHNTPTVCGIEASMAQTILVEAIQESVPEAHQFPRQLIRVEEEIGGGRLWMDGLDEMLLRSYETGRLPAELDIPWAVAGREITLSDEFTDPASSSAYPSIPSALHAGQTLPA